MSNRSSSDGFVMFDVRMLRSSHLSALCFLVKYIPTKATPLKKIVSSACG